MVVEGGSSVGRATLMAAIYFAARIWDQETRAANVAALAAAILLCLRPLQIVDAGFALTFGATLGILIGLSRLPGLLAMPWWAQPVAALLAASLCAEVVLLPIGALVFSRVTFAGLLINLAAIPLMAVAQIAGMIAVALASWAPEPARWTGWVAHLAVEGLIGSAAARGPPAVVDAAPCAAVTLDRGRVLRRAYCCLRHCAGRMRLDCDCRVRRLDCCRSHGDAARRGAPAASGVSRCGAGGRRCRPVPRRSHAQHRRRRTAWQGLRYRLACRLAGVLGARRPAPGLHERHSRRRRPHRRSGERVSRFRTVRGLGRRARSAA